MVGRYDAQRALEEELDERLSDFEAPRVVMAEGAASDRFGSGKLVDHTFYVDPRTVNEENFEEHASVWVDHIQEEVLQEQVHDTVFELSEKVGIDQFILPDVRIRSRKIGEGVDETSLFRGSAQYDSSSDRMIFNEDDRSKIRSQGIKNPDLGYLIFF
mgnify:FL=1